MGLLAPILVRLGVTVAVTVGLLLIAQTAPRTQHGRGALALALGLGYAIGQGLLRGFAAPPIEAVDWLAYNAAAAGVFGATAETIERPVWAGWRWAARVVLILATVGVLLSPLVRGIWTPHESALRVAAFAAVWLLAWSNSEALAERLGSGVGFPLVLTAVGVVIVTGVSGSIVLAALAIVAVAVLAVGWVVGGAGPAVSWDAAAIAVVVVLLGGVLTVGLAYGEVPPISAVLLAAAPAGGWADRILPLQRLRCSYFTCEAARFVAVLAMLAAAVASAVWVSPDDGVWY